MSKKKCIHIKTIGTLKFQKPIYSYTYSKNGKLFWKLYHIYNKLILVLGINASTPRLFLTELQYIKIKNNTKLFCKYFYYSPSKY